MDSNKIKWLKYLDERNSKKPTKNHKNSLYLVGVYYPKPKGELDKVPFEQRCDNPDQKQLKYINDRMVGLPITIEHPNSGLSSAKDFKRNTYGKCVYSQILNDGRAVFIAEIPFITSINSLSDAKISIARTLLEKDPSLRSVSLGHDYEVVMDNTSGQILKEVFTPDHIAICKTGTQRKEGCHILSSFKGYSDMISGKEGFKDLSSNRHMIRDLMRDFDNGEQTSSSSSSNRGLSLFDDLINEREESNFSQSTMDSSNVIRESLSDSYHAEQIQVNCSHGSNETIIRRRGNKRKRHNINQQQQQQQNNRDLIEKIQIKIKKKKSITTRFCESLEDFHTLYNRSHSNSNSCKKKKNSFEKKEIFHRNFLVMNSSSEQQQQQPTNTTTNNIGNDPSSAVTPPNPSDNQNTSNMGDDQSMNNNNNNNNNNTTDQSKEGNDTTDSKKPSTPVDISIEDIEKMKSIISSTGDDKSKEELVNLMTEMLEHQTKKVQEMSGQLGKYQEEKLLSEKDGAIKKRDTIIEMFTNLASISPDSDLSDEQRVKISESQKEHWRKQFPIESCSSVSNLNAINQRLDGLTSAFKTTVVASREGVNRLQKSISQARQFENDNRQRVQSFTKDIQSKSMINNNNNNNSMSSPTSRFNAFSTNNDFEQRLLQFGIRKRQRTTRHSPYPSQRSFTNNSSPSTTSSSSSSFSSSRGFGNSFGLSNNISSRAVSVNASKTSQPIVEKKVEANPFSEGYDFFNQFKKKFSKDTAWTNVTDDYKPF